MTNRAAFDAWYAALDRVDVDAIVGAFAEDGSYQDMPVDAEPVVGRAAIRKKLQALEAFERFECRFLLIVEDGDRTVSERTERWYLRTGATVDLPVMSVMEFRDGAVTRLREYWDLRTVRRQLPPDSES